MAKEENNNNFALVALVAIVAVVGLVSLVMMQGTNNKTPAYSTTEDGNLVGDARLARTYLDEGSTTCGWDRSAELPTCIKGSCPSGKTCTETATFCGCK